MSAAPVPRDVLRERMVVALAAVEAVRPFVNTGRDADLLSLAWDILWKEAMTAVTDYVEASRG